MAKQDNSIIKNSLSTVQGQKVLRREGKPKMMSGQVYFLCTPCYQNVKGLPGCFTWEKQTACLRARASGVTLAVPPEETEHVGQNQHFDCGAKV